MQSAIPVVSNLTARSCGSEVCCHLRTSRNMREAAKYAQSSANNKAQHAFVATGIYPYRPNIVSDEDFEPSDITRKDKLPDDNLGRTGIQTLTLPLREHLTYAMELSPSRGAAKSAAPQEFTSILRNPKVHYRVHKSPPPVPILSQINSIHPIPSYLSKIHFNTVHPPTPWSSQWSLSFWPFHQ
jgi:hypothetical protein